MTGKGNTAFGGSCLAADDIAKRSFSSAIRANDGIELARSDSEFLNVQRFEPVKQYSQVVYLKQMRSGAEAEEAE